MTNSPRVSDNFFLPARMTFRRDQQEIFDFLQFDETDAFYHAYYVLKLYDQIHRKFCKDFPRIESFVDDVNDFIELADNNYNLEDRPAKIDFCMYLMEEIRAFNRRTVRNLTQIWRKISSHVHHIAISIRRDDIWRGRLPIYLISLLAEIYNDLITIACCIELLISKRKEYFRLKTYVLSHAFPN